MRDLWLLTHFIGLVIGAGSGFALFVISFLAKGFPEDARRPVLLQLFTLRYISYLGLVLLLLSGLLLAQPYWPGLGQMPYFMVKLVAVGGIVAMSAWGLLLMQRIKRAPDAAHFARLGMAGKISFTLSMIVIAAAVFSFH